MKTKILLSMLTFVLTISAFGQSTMELTFTAENSSLYVPLDSILIENLTQGGDTTLYTPDTVLVLDIATSTRDNVESGATTLSVSQNYPNPFYSKTSFDIKLPESAQVKILVQDIMGRVLVQRESLLNQGNHSFTFYPGNQKYYLLTVSGIQTSKTIKMVPLNSNPVNAGRCKLVYEKYEHGSIGFKSHKATNSFEFMVGDELKYTSYTDVEVATITDTPTGSQTYVFQFDGWTPCPAMSMVTDFDGNRYNTVQIGSQCWMKENLRVGTMINSEEEQTDNNIIEKYCYVYYVNYCNIYGGLYQWDEMMQYSTDEGVQGICPEGWHLPTDAEWRTLEMSLGMTQLQADSVGWRGTDEGGKLKESSSDYWLAPNLGATNSSGFSGLPGGNRSVNGLEYNLTSAAFFWSSNEHSPGAWIRYLHYTSAQVYRAGYDKANGFSVRCIMN